MNEVEIKITGTGYTFGAITKAIELLLTEVGAKVKLELDHSSGIVSFEEAKTMANQIVGRNITIKTYCIPIGG